METWEVAVHPRGGGTTTVYTEITASTESLAVVQALTKWCAEGASYPEIEYARREIPRTLAAQAGRDTFFCVTREEARRLVDALHYLSCTTGRQDGDQALAEWLEDSMPSVEPEVEELATGNQLELITALKADGYRVVKLRKVDFGRHTDSLGHYDIVEEL